MSVTKRAMVINSISGPRSYNELISLDEFNTNPYYYTHNNLWLLENGSIAESTDNGQTWTQVLPYKEHSYEYAVIYGINDDKMQVYGNKIGLQFIDKNLTKNYTLGQPIFEFHRDDKLLLEVNKRIRIVHNINQAKLIYDMKLKGPRI
jgi:uncharacterized protein with WD repeat